MITEVMPAKTEAFIARRAMVAFGREKQQLKTIEELGELQTALAKFMLGLVKPEAVITEIADVQVMMLQMERFFGRLQVAEERCKKLQRLSDNIDAIKMEGDV